MYCDGFSSFHTPIHCSYGCNLPSRSRIKSTKLNLVTAPVCGRAIPWIIATHVCCTLNDVPFDLRYWSGQQYCRLSYSRGKHVVHVLVCMLYADCHDAWVILIDFYNFLTSNLLLCLFSIWDYSMCGDRVDAHANSPNADCRKCSLSHAHNTNLRYSKWKINTLN